MFVLILTVGVVAGVSSWKHEQRERRFEQYAFVETLIRETETVLKADDSGDLVTVRDGRVKGLLGRPYLQVLNLSPFRMAHLRDPTIRTRADPRGHCSAGDFNVLRIADVDYVGPSKDSISAVFASSFEHADCPGKWGDQLPLFLIVKHGGADVRITVPQKLADQLGIQDHIGVFRHLRNFGIQVPGPLIDDDSVVVVPFSQVKGAVIAAARGISERTYSESQVEDAFVDLYAATLKPPTILGMELGSRDAAQVAPYLCLAFAFVFWHRMRRVSTRQANHDEPWLLLHPRDFVERSSATLLVALLLLSFFPVAIALHEIADHSIGCALVEIAPSQALVVLAVCRIWRINRAEDSD